jgi:hypothetical protein
VRRSTGRIKCQSRNGLSQLITDNIYIYNYIISIYIYKWQ